MCKRCANDVISMFESPDVENLLIMKLVWIMKNSCGSFKPMQAVDGELKLQFRWPNQITNISSCMVWPFLNVILFVGNSPYTCICNYINKTFLLLTDVPKIVLVCDKMYFLQYHEAFADDLFIATYNPTYYSFENALNNRRFSVKLTTLPADCSTVV